MFIKVVDTIVSQEKVDESIDNDKESERNILSEIEQSEYDVLYGDQLSEQPE